MILKEWFHHKVSRFIIKVMQVVIDDGIANNTSHGYDVHPEELSDLIRISEYLNCNEIECNQKPHSGKNEFQRYNWSDTCEGADDHPEQLEEDDECDRMHQHFLVVVEIQKEPNKENDHYQKENGLGWKEHTYPTKIKIL